MANRLVPLRAISIRLPSFRDSSRIIGLLDELEFITHDGSDQLEYVLFLVDQVMSEIECVLFILVNLLANLFGFKTQLVSE